MWDDFSVSPSIMYFWELRLLGDIKSDVSGAPEMWEKVTRSVPLLIYVVLDREGRSGSSLKRQKYWLSYITTGKKSLIGIGKKKGKTKPQKQNPHKIQLLVPIYEALDREEELNLLSKGWRLTPTHQQHSAVTGVPSKVMLELRRSHHSGAKGYEAERSRSAEEPQDHSPQSLGMDTSTQRSSQSREWWMFRGKSEIRKNNNQAKAQGHSPKTVTVPLGAPPPASSTKGKWHNYVHCLPHTMFF